ncbi:ABC transporter permease [Marinibactrum halimedae]|uniref:ABC transporter permease n=1 Tax=Marinibactrum halimedae TaxID=1444977 RepID=UPI001E5AF148|nr:ABC transporter permease [Marinibactrum halimedae]MCD9457943.1 ABC transporter permease [Marinibactrum halimedae]
MNSSIRFLELTGMNWLIPLVNLMAGRNPKAQITELFKVIGVPIAAFAIFLLLWSVAAKSIVTSLGNLPGPTQTWAQFESLVEEHRASREKEAAFYQRQKYRNEKRIAKGKEPKKIRAYTGAPTFFDQIFTSLYTVFFGFFIATAIAIPIGIICGLNTTIYTGLNPLIQIFRPVSPLAWLPIVTMVVSAVYTTDDPLVPKSFITSALTVTLCSLWPTLINTTVGVSSIDRDFINVCRVLQLNWINKIFKVVLPASLPMIFTGLRLSLGVGWMVLIAAEMLAQNPGLGKFVWDEFQNGSSNSLGRILVAVFVIGCIGFLLDRIMLTLQKSVSHDKTQDIR